MVKTMDLKKPHRQNSDSGCLYRWGLLVGGVESGDGGRRVGNRGHEISVNGEDGEKLLSTLSPNPS